MLGQTPERARVGRQPIGSRSGHPDKNTLGASDVAEPKMSSDVIGAGRDSDAPAASLNGFGDQVPDSVG